MFFLQNFDNMDLLVNAVNARFNETGIRLFYSTPSCYVKVNKLNYT